MPTDPDLLQRYNYPSFTPEHFEPWMRFDRSPPLGQAVEDFPLTGLDGTEDSLHAALKQNAWTLVEFGSFT